MNVIHQLALYWCHYNLYAYYDLTSIKAALNSTISRFYARIRAGVSISDAIITHALNYYFFQPNSFFHTLSLHLVSGITFSFYR